MLAIQSLAHTAMPKHADPIPRALIAFGLGSSSHALHQEPEDDSPVVGSIQQQLLVLGVAIWTRSGPGCWCCCVVPVCLCVMAPRFAWAVLSDGAVTARRHGGRTGGLTRTDTTVTVTDSPGWRLTARAGRPSDGRVLGLNLGDDLGLHRGFTGKQLASWGLEENEFDLTTRARPGQPQQPAATRMSEAVARADRVSQKQQVNVNPSLR